MYTPEQRRELENTMQSIRKIQTAYRLDAHYTAQIQTIMNNPALMAINDIANRHSITYNKWMEEVTPSLTAFRNYISHFSITPMTQAMQDAVISSNYTMMRDALMEELCKPLINISDFAFLKLTFLEESILRQTIYPEGLSSALNALNACAAVRLANCTDISYEVSTKRFIETNNPDHKATVNEMNVICAGADIFENLAADEEDAITESEMMDFLSFLESQRTFAATTTTGEKIRKLIENGARIDFDCDVYFHARYRDESTCPYTYSQMLKAPSGMPGPGRFNFAGQSYYYFANSKDGAIAEIRKHNKAKSGSVQTARIYPVKPISLLDLSGTMPGGRVFLKYIRFPLSDENSKMPREYLIPNFVSDCCRSLDIEGIKYLGSSKYSNYVCWNDGYFAFDGMEDEINF